MAIEVLKKLGFSDKSALVYESLLRLGPSSVRTLALKSGLNRGTVYEMLKWLRERSLVSFYEKEAKQYFVAEDPSRLREVVTHRFDELKEIERDIGRLIPELKSLYDKGGERPVARYYEKAKLREILEDVLATCERTGELQYRIYSAVDIREYLYDSFQTFSDVRIAKGIAVRVIAIGEGGQLRGLDERKWLKVDNLTPTYILLYPSKTAYISLDAKKEPVGVVIENEGVYQTQKVIFDQLWATLA